MLGAGLFLRPGSWYLAAAAPLYLLHTNFKVYSGVMLRVSVYCHGRPRTAIVTAAMISELGTPPGPPAIPAGGACGGLICENA